MSTPVAEGPTEPDSRGFDVAPGPVTVQMGGRTVYDAHRTTESAEWAEKLKYIPTVVHALTGPESGIPAEMERWESWHLAYVQKLAEDLHYLTTTATSIIARRDGAV